MNKYKIVIEKPAEKFIIKLPKSEKERVLKAIFICIVDAGNRWQIYNKYK